MTHKAFWSDPYLTQYTTTVTSVQGAEISVASTIFFAFSGGQESDYGTMGDYPVLAAHKQGLDIRYTLPADHKLCVGQTIQIEIDGNRRQRLMRLHFAAELVLEMLTKSVPGIVKTGAHIGQDKARIDFSWPESLAPMLNDIAAAANQIIAEDLQINTGFDDEPNERRYWEIDGYSKVPCGGTHVRRTGEIGPIKLKRNNRGRGIERVEIFLTS